MPVAIIIFFGLRKKWAVLIKLSLLIILLFLITSNSARITYFALLFILITFEYVNTTNLNQKIKILLPTLIFIAGFLGIFNVNKTQYSNDYFYGEYYPFRTLKFNETINQIKDKIPNEIIIDEQSLGILAPIGFYYKYFIDSNVKITMVHHDWRINQYGFRNAENSGSKKIIITTKACEIYSNTQMIKLNFRVSLCF